MLLYVSLKIGSVISQNDCYILHLSSLFQLSIHLLIYFCNLNDYSQKTNVMIQLSSLLQITIILPEQKFKSQVSWVDGGEMFSLTCLMDLC